MSRKRMGGAAIEVQGLHFSYPDTPAVLKDLSFRVERGSVNCILGPNGVGKTTLLHCMASLALPDAGAVLLDGRDISGMNPTEIARSLAFVPQAAAPTFEYGVLDYVVTGCAPHISLFGKPQPEHYDAARRSLELLDLNHLSTKACTHISTGELQQVIIARAIAQNTDILLMDEPTAHLDYGNRIKVLKIIKKLSADGYAIVLSTHNPEHAIMLGGTVAALGLDGSVTFGNQRDVITGEFLSSLYGVGIDVRHIEDIDRDVCVAHEL